MASLDKMEGDAVEGIGILLLALLAYFAYLAYKGVSGFKFPALSDILGSISAMINNLLNGAIAKVTPDIGATGSHSDIQVFTGTNQGQWVTPQSDTVDYQIPDQPLQQFSWPGQYIDPLSDPNLPQVQLPKVG
jgi:hypothetical protein